MIELRQRSRSRSGGYSRLSTEEEEDDELFPAPATHRSGGYSRLNTEDEDDDDLLPLPTIHRPKPVQSRESRACARCCFIFSLSAIIFLSSLAVMFALESPYVKINTEYNNKKRELLKGVGGALAMYIFCGIVSGYFLLRRRRIDYMIDDDPGFAE
mmetsp:Transcript_29421/g.32077  ORF Transcript_29421/g.32077 Transcript_29421/m.32077 type:complete len:156 (-) Transcript_29421:241-708(-)|eukprot:CAMPEP_0173159566 /NCGR_PEP_ID=MMETSP1105-20130129/17213_1 /TAXON_ID=2985 /ORGANISM="Ochromonas sp., Strain BG-1" /LENGTH=155 /DNA_ID=CAMNT_0014078079 /DNA_START=175 /DNA_END=642 /DNA_ORIENTATION=-